MTATTLDILTPVALHIDRQAILSYARITGDFNPIHVDPEFAAKTPLGGVIAHGTLSLNLIWQSLAATFGSEVLRGAAIDVRFTKPVRVGDTVEAGGRRSADVPGRYDVWVRNQEGTNVIEGTAALSATREESK
jgi:3-hydroxybutyryl-CoA dehydratase